MRVKVLAVCFTILLACTTYILPDGRSMVCCSAGSVVWCV